MSTDTIVSVNQFKPSPRRVTAGRLNRQRRLGLTAAGRERLRQAALAHRPWERSTGPRTPAGKARSSQNAKFRQAGESSVREVRRLLAGLTGLIRDMRKCRERADDP